MNTNTNFLINELELNGSTFECLFKISDPKQAVWKPSPNKWCLLEIVSHLVDEEVFDFKTRTRAALSNQPFTPIDPVEWVTSKAYIKQDYQSKVEEWVSEREASLTWLRSLRSPDWSSFLVHNELGKMSAGLFLENWVAHDFIHLRQIIRTKRSYLGFLADEDLSYAGKW